MPITASTLSTNCTRSLTSMASTPTRHHMSGMPDAPGICGSFWFRPKLARPLGELVEVLLRGPSSLTAGERALIAAYIAGLNGCRHCCSAHSAYAAAQSPGGMALVEQVRADPERAPIPAKLKALLKIASAVRQGGAATGHDMTAARAADATETEIHDCVLIAAALWHVPPPPRSTCHNRPEHPPAS